LEAGVCNNTGASFSGNKRMVGSGSKKHTVESIGNVATVWRLLHLIVVRYGSVPTGQHLIAFTLNILHETGYSPTLSELCKVTGLPKASVSRYVSWQIANGYLTETVDPNDRRQRFLEQTAKGKAEMQRLNVHLDDLFDYVTSIKDELNISLIRQTPEQIMARMEELTKATEKNRN
jgi:DNA-binding MarR family transcriptional regulator